MKGPYSEFDWQDHRKAYESSKRIEESGIKEGMQIVVGGQFAEKYGYEIYVGALAHIYSIMEYDAKAIVVLKHSEKLRVIPVEDCLIPSERLPKKE